MPYNTNTEIYKDGNGTGILSSGIGQGTLKSTLVPNDPSVPSLSCTLFEEGYCSNGYVWSVSASDPTLNAGARLCCVPVAPVPPQH